MINPNPNVLKILALFQRVVKGDSLEALVQSEEGAAVAELFRQTPSGSVPEGASLFCKCPHCGLRFEQSLKEN